MAAVFLGDAMKITKTKLLLGAMAFPIALFGGPAMAADGLTNDRAESEAASEPQDSTPTVADIVVTARRRQESILKVPVVAAVLGSQELERTATVDLIGVAARVPGLQLGNSVAAFGNQVALRGIGTTTNNSAIDQSVSLNIDGMQFSQGLSYAMGFFDMQQVEVLKGPQALFFGKASPAGVISIRTADPGNEFEMIARGGYEFESRTTRGELVLSGPLSDTLGVRLAGSYAEGDGFFRNTGQVGNLGTLANLNPQLAPFAGIYGPLGSLGAANPTASRVPHTENLMLRGTAVFEPSDTFNARLKVSYGDSRAEGPGYDVHMASCPDGVGPTNGAGVAFLSPNEDCRVDRVTQVVSMDPAAFPGVYNGGVPFGEIEQFFSTLEMNYELNPNLTLSSVSGYLDLKQQFMTNGSASSNAGPAFVVQGGYERKDFTQELRLTSDNSGPFNFLLGGFYQDSEQVGTVSLPANQRLGELLGFLSGLRGGNANPACNMPALLANPRGCSVFPPNLSEGTHSMDVTVYSLFGQVLYKLTDQLELGLGARWTDETRKHVQRTTLPVNLGVVPLSVPQISSSNVSPELTLTYTPTDDFTVFASLKQAYKSGSYIFSGLFNPGENASFGDERVRGAELGIKSVLAGGEVRLNLAGYYYKYDDLQVGLNEITSAGNYIIYTRNAAGADSYGIDFDVNYSPASIDGLRLAVAASWNRSQFTNFKAPCWGGQTVAQGCNLDPDPTANARAGGYVSQDLSGSPLVRAPEWQMSGNIDYDMSVGKDMTLAFGLGGQFSSRFLTNTAARADMYQPSYFKFDANIALRGPDGAWELALIGTNLANKIIRGNCSNGGYADSSTRIQPVVTGRGDTVFPAIANRAGTEELICAPIPGRSVQLRATFKL